MFINGNIFWFLMGVLLIPVAAAFKMDAEKRGWTITWWKGLIVLAWYAILCVTLYSGGILMGENEIGAGIKLLLAGHIFLFITGVPLWRLLSSVHP
ncbi:MAG: hypothetical protein JRH15_22165 [Deltaproteobacteria bacterium]|nr:hypothetical protein [Deltaproteobacteria bacterium]